MPQSLVKNLIHLVYATRHREPWIPKDVRDRLFAYQAGIFKDWESPALVIGGVEDHVHALFSLSKNHALKKIVEEVKKGSSKWMKTNRGASNPGRTTVNALPESETLSKSRVPCSLTERPL